MFKSVDSGAKLPRSGRSSMVAIGHMWLPKFKYIKIK